MHSRNPTANVGGSAYQTSGATGSTVGLAALAANNEVALSSGGAEHPVMADTDPLVKACKAGDAKLLRSLIRAIPVEKRNHAINNIDRNGSTLIYHTVWPGHLDALEVLLSYGATPNIENNRLNTPLHLACERGHKQLIKLLIDNGSEIDSLNWQKKKCWEVCEDATVAADLQQFVQSTHTEYLERVQKKFIALTTPEERARYKVMFDSIDTDEDGWISYDEVEPLLIMASAKASPPLPKPNPVDIREFFDWIDLDKDGVLSFPEFLRGILLTQDEIAATAKLIPTPAVKVDPRRDSKPTKAELKKASGSKK